jgi:hypothetical protein
VKRLGRGVEREEMGKKESFIHVLTLNCMNLRFLSIFACQKSKGSGLSFLAI